MFILNRFSLIWAVMPYYDYWYESLMLLKLLCKKTNEIEADHGVAIENTLVLSPLYIKHFDSNTIYTLMLNDKIKYHILHIQLKDEMDTIEVWKMLRFNFSSKKGNVINASFYSILWLPSISNCLIMNVNLLKRSKMTKIFAL